MSAPSSAPATAPVIRGDTFLQTCKSCAHEFRAPAKLVGKGMPCPYCRKLMVVVGPAPVQNEDRLVGRVVGGCRLIKRLGAGAMGVVYAAEQVSVSRQVAIKMLSSKAASDPEVVQRFEREAKLCAAIRHPNVVAVYDCGFEKGVNYLSMEWVDGCSFAGLIEEHGKLTWQDAAAYILQIARALEHVHGQHIIHRDIKPANVLINMNGEAKLADLGLAKQVDADGGMGLTMQGVAMGSPAYMPPEQIRSAKDATPVSDLYALGASFYQAVSGKLPFDGRSATEVMGKVLREPAPPITTHVPDLPPAIAAFIDRSLTKDPAGRLQNATLFIKELEAAVANPNVLPKGKGKAKASGVPSSSAGGYDSHTIILIAAISVGIIALGVVAFLVLW